jgi:hypothetical protein
MPTHAQSHDGEEEGLRLCICRAGTMHMHPCTVQARLGTRASVCLSVCLRLCAFVCMRLCEGFESAV